MPKTGAFNVYFFGQKTTLEFHILTLALQNLNCNCFMSHTLAFTSQKAKVYLLRSSNNRPKIWQFPKSSTEHCPYGVTIEKLSLVRFFMQLLQFLALTVVLLSLIHI